MLSLLITRLYFYSFRAHTPLSLHAFIETNLHFFSIFLGSEFIYFSLYVLFVINYLSFLFFYLLVLLFLFHIKLRPEVYLFSNKIYKENKRKNKEIKY
jgi:hypothetical protein